MRGKCAMKQEPGTEWAGVRYMMAHGPGGASMRQAPMFSSPAMLARRP